MSKEIFGNFYSQFAEHMIENHPDLCFFGYGSNFKDKKVPSDLDGGIICPDIITPKRDIIKISDKISSLAKKFKIPENKIQFNLFDIKTSKDGRFIAYDIYYTTFLKDNAWVLSGPDYLNLLNGIDNRYGELESSAFNLRGVRNDFLMSGFKDIEEQNKKTIKLIENIKGLPLKLVKLYNIREFPDNYAKRLSGDLGRCSKKDFIKKILVVMPEINSDFLYFLSSDNSNKFRKDELRVSWAILLSFYEDMIKQHIDKFPPLERIVKTYI